MIPCKMSVRERTNCIISYREWAKAALESGRYIKPKKKPKTDTLTQKKKSLKAKETLKSIKDLEMDIDKVLEYLNGA